MSIGPIKDGHTQPWTITVRKLDGNTLDISGATYAGGMRDVSTTITFGGVGGGTFTGTDETNGVFTYAPVAADVATPGTYDLRFKLTVGGKVYKMGTILVIEEDWL